MTTDVSPADRTTLLALATDAILTALLTGRQLLPDVDDLPATLRDRAATFVTLEAATGDLLGCIGTLEAHRPLGIDVAANALASAFHDPRLPAVTFADFETMSIKVSVLSEKEQVEVDSFAALRASLAPRTGLLVEAGGHRATFLPSVWEKVRDEHEFLALLWRKAGLAPGEWPAAMRVYRYSSTEFGHAGPRSRQPLAS